MTLIKCRECNNEISDKAVLCPSCGAAGASYWWSAEYRSKRTLWGLPLVHVVLGSAFNPVTGKIRVAKGIIAIGGIAVGVVAVGGVSLGAIAMGGLTAGLACFGGLALGVILAVGGLAVGFVALGGAAIGYYAIGGGAWGVHALGENARDPQLLEFFKGRFGR
ncbi:MAG: zinc ribbon domain-containing protein [Phycisphaerales bacterium]|nr:MAG: zinc ribbon domain-containing protein [Phycisphaerales bacterium]